MEFTTAEGKPMLGQHVDRAIRLVAVKAGFDPTGWGRKLVVDPSSRICSLRACWRWKTLHGSLGIRISQRHGDTFSTREIDPDR
jgi:hypothetical protein